MQSGENMRNPLSQIKNRQYRKWIEEKLEQGQVIDMDEFQLLTHLQNKRVLEMIRANGFSVNLGDYTWLNDFATVIDISITRTNPENERPVPGWARQDDSLKAIFKAGIYNKQHAFWIKKRHIKKGKILEPLEDIIPLVLLFEEKETQDLINLYRNDPDATMEITPDLNRYKTVGDLNRLLTFLRPPQLMGEFEDHVDVLGRVGEWKILFPRTMHGSMMCDPKDETTWCTVRKSGGNLFLNYVARPDSKTSLYYVVSQDPQRRLDNAASWFSFGYEDGALNLDGEMGGISVDGKNQGLTAEILDNRFDPDELTQIEIISNTHATSIGTMHPAKQDMIAATQSIVMFRAATDTLTKEERMDFVSILLEYGQLAPAVWRRILTTNFLRPENKKGFGFYQYSNFMLSKAPRGVGIPEDIFRIYFDKRYSYITPKSRAKKKSPQSFGKDVLTNNQSEFLSLAQAVSLPNDMREFVMKDKDLQPGFAGRNDLTQQEFDYLYKIAKKRMGVLEQLVNNISPTELVNEFINTKQKVRKYPPRVMRTILTKLARESTYPDDFILTYPPLDIPQLLWIKIGSLDRDVIGRYIETFLDVLYSEMKRLNRMTEALNQLSITILIRAMRSDKADIKLSPFLDKVYLLIKDNPRKQKMFREMILLSQFSDPDLLDDRFMAMKPLQIPIILMHGIQTDVYHNPQFMPFIVRALLEGPKDDKLIVLEDMYMPFDAFTPEQLMLIQSKVGDYRLANLLDFQEPGSLTRENIEAYSFLGLELFRYAIDEWSVDRNPTNENIEDGLPDWLLRIIVSYQGRDKEAIMQEAYPELVDDSPWKYFFECESKLVAEKAKAKSKARIARKKARARR
jgi:hypothetical protein